MDSETHRPLTRLVVTGIFVALACAAPASGQNLLANPGFDTGDFTGWSTFGNAFVEAANPPQFVPQSGTHLCSMFGNFPGGFNVTGIFQQFPAAPGDSFEIDAASRHFSGDPLVGAGAPADNWVVMKIAFFDGSSTEIGAAEGTILDGTFATDVWHDNAPVSGTAPAGTVNVQALVLYLQPAFDGGAGHVDDVEFRRLYELSTTQDPASLDVTITLSGGEPNAPFGLFHSFDPANGTSPGTGLWGGLHISPADLNVQIGLALSATPFFGGTLDANGGATLTIPGAAAGGLTGISVWSNSAHLTTDPQLVFSAVVATTFL